MLLDHSNELVQVFREGNLIKSIDLKNGQPRLVNHYHGVFQEAFLNYRSRKSNLDFAIPLHRLLFSAMRHS